MVTETQCKRECQQTSGDSLFELEAVLIQQSLVDFDDYQSGVTKRKNLIMTRASASGKLAKHKGHHKSLIVPAVHGANFANRS